MSGLCLAGLATGLLQWGAWGAELGAVQSQQSELKTDIRLIKKDIRKLERSSAVAETILRGLAEKSGVVVPDKSD
jgi:recombinational DNA repair protein (RecF pathway)